jgi:hypothetical protein
MDDIRPNRQKNYDTYIARPSSHRKMTVGAQNRMRTSSPLRTRLPVTAHNTIRKSVAGVSAVKPMSTQITMPIKNNAAALKPIQKNSVLPVARKTQKTHLAHVNTQPSARQHSSSSTLRDSKRIALQAVQQTSFSGNNRGMQYAFPIHAVQSTKVLFFKRLFYGMGVVVMLCTILISAHSFMLNSQAEDQIEALTATDLSADSEGVPQGTGSEPAESKPNNTAFSTYQVSPDSPRYLKIPSLDVKSRIKSLGITSDGAVDAPWNIHDTGWYDGTIKPGSKNGVSLLLGHVSGVSGPGVFKNIGSLNQKDAIEVERGDGVIIRYEVEKIVTVPVESIDMAEILYGIEPGTQSLRLMTCAGSYNKDTKQFSSRTIVYANPVK